MRSLVGQPAGALLEQPVFDAEGRLLGHVAAVGSRQGELRRIGIDIGDAGPAGALRFVARERFTVESDHVVLGS